MRGAMELDPVALHLSRPNRDRIIIVNLFARGSSVLVVRFDFPMLLRFFVVLLRRVRSLFEIYSVSPRITMHL